jgi:putative pyruvate formate lyase activating enzyme
MNQYTPLPQVKDHPLLHRKVTAREYERVLDYALEIGVEQGFMQTGETAAESFIPEFDGEGVKS